MSSTCPRVPRYVTAYLPAGTAFPNLRPYHPGDTVHLITQNVAPTLIGAAVQGGKPGLQYTLQFGDNLTSVHAGITATQMEILAKNGQRMQFECVTTGQAKQIGGDIGMGRYVSLDPVDQIGDWIGANTTAWTVVDVSDDGVQKGAVAAFVAFRWTHDLGPTPLGLLIKPYGSGDGTNYCARSIDLILHQGLVHIPVGLDGNGRFEAKFFMDWSGSCGGHSAAVKGYWI